MDQDPVSYSIISGDNSSNFVMDNRTGVVRLVSHRKPNLIGPYYSLNISASDGLHVSQATLIVAILDINNHKPVFKDCDTYRPVIAENRPRGSPVIQVGWEKMLSICASKKWLFPMENTWITRALKVLDILEWKRKTSSNLVSRHVSLIN